MLWGLLLQAQITEVRITFALRLIRGWTINPHNVQLSRFYYTHPQENEQEKCNSGVFWKYCDIGLSVLLSFALSNPMALKVVMLPY